MKQALCYIFYIASVATIGSAIVTASDVTVCQPISIEDNFRTGDLSMQEVLMAELWFGSANNWTYSRSESTSVAKMLWPMLSWVQGNSDWLFNVGGRTFAVLVEQLALAQEFAVWLLVVEIGIEVLNWTVIPSIQAISTVVQGQGRVSADCVLGVWRSPTLNCSSTVKSFVIIIVSRLVRVKAAEVQRRLEAVKIYVFRRPAASWGNL